MTGQNGKNNRDRIDAHSKQEQLDQFRRDNKEQYLTTNQGTRVNHTDDSLKAGERGPTLMEDFHFREKMTHFDHERIPERVVHARGSGAHGYFQPYETAAQYSRAAFLQNPEETTPVFVRFSTVVGSRGSADTVRDARGFATKFYTSDGVFDLVSNNIPVFFIQDGIKFPDVVHAIKPEPHHEMPQASAAHDTFWDFISLMPESMHMIMWLMSDRGIPRSFSMMEGFGVHTFRLIDAAGIARFVKFHWKSVLGTHGLVWDEAQKLAGKDPDWLRRDLWESIEMGNFPEFELGVQIVEEADEFAFDFDLLDPTKIIPEELVPVTPLGKMVLNRNPDNFFAETEQVAFHPGHIVPGIDFTNDPLLQARLFSYLDTQLIRLGGPNFHEIPINRSVAPVHNNQQGGFHRQTINQGRVNYSPNSLGGGCPMTAPQNMGGFVHHQEKVDGHKIRERSGSFKDFFTQPKLFWDSMSGPEKQHIIDAFHFELGKVDSKEVRQRMVDMISNVDQNLAQQVAMGIGIDGISDKAHETRRDAMTTDGRDKRRVDRSPALSMLNTRKDSIQGRRVAILAAHGVDQQGVKQLKEALQAGGAQAEVVSMYKGELNSTGDESLMVDKNYVTTASIMYDAVFVPGGYDSVEALKTHGEALHFVNEAFKHRKPIGAIGDGIGLLLQAHLTGIDIADARNTEGIKSHMGVITAGSGSVDAFVEEFIDAIKQHRFWERETLIANVPA